MNNLNYRKAFVGITVCIFLLILAGCSTPASGSKLVKYSHYDGVKVCTYKVSGNTVHVNQKHFKGVGSKCPKYIRG